MVILERRLERIALAGSRRTTSRRLLGASDEVGVVGHEAVGFLGVLLATPDPEGNQDQGTENSRTTDTDNDTDDGVASLGRHAGGLLVIRVEGCRMSRLCRGSLCGLGAIGVRLGDDLDRG